MPVRAIADLAHAAGALLLVDGAQTAGQIPLDMRALGADFYAVSGQKWLLGPQATDALFVAREQARAIEPLFTTHALADDRRLRAETALAPSPLSRFRLTAQAPALVAGLARAIGLVQEIGSEAIEAHVNRLAARLRRGVATIEGCAITGPTDPSVACGLVAVAIEGWEPRQTVEALLSRGRITARAVNQPPAVRFSTGAFNTEAEVDLVLETLSAIARERPPVEAPAAADR
jgi:selenocysteine lyase/cysteine desulfurase